MGAAARARKKKLMSLQLTSLLDMFTIILVFLMVSFQAEDMDFVLHAGLDLPESTAQNPFKNAVNIAIGKNAVYVEGDVVLELEDGFVDKSVGDFGRIPAVEDAVKAAWEKRQDEEADPEPVATIQAEKELPYPTIHVVMRSAAFAGCYRFRLVVEKE